MSDISYSRLLREVEEGVLEGEGMLNRRLRRLAFNGSDVPDDVASYVDKVRRNAYKVVDRDVERMHAAGYSDDQIFELTIATALGEGHRRLEVALSTLRRIPRGGH